MRSLLLLQVQASVVRSMSSSSSVTSNNIQRRGSYNDGYTSVEHIYFLLFYWLGEKN